MSDKGFSQATGNACAIVTSILTDNPSAAVEVLKGMDPAEELMTTMAMGAMLAAAMEMIAQINGTDDVMTVWQGSILHLLTADPAD